MSGPPEVALPFSDGETYRVTQSWKTTFTHKGASQYSVDFATPYDTTVQAVEAGEVVAVEASLPDGAASSQNPSDPSMGPSQIGNFVTLRHSDTLYSSYLHLQPASTALSLGDRVERGQVIGRIGHTGRRTGAHMHVQMGGGLVAWKAGKLADGTQGPQPPAVFEGLEGAPVTGQRYGGSPRSGASSAATGARLPLLAHADPSVQANRDLHHAACEQGPGRFPITADGWWHNGVHLHADGDEGRRALCAMFDGTVVACRLSMPPVGGRSANFVLLEHAPGRAIFYSLYLHLEPLDFPARLDDAHPIRRHGLAWLERAYYDGGALRYADLNDLLSRTKALKTPVRVRAGDALGRMGVGFEGDSRAPGPAVPFCHLELFSLHAENAGSTIYKQLGREVNKLVLRDLDQDVLAEPEAPLAYPVAADPNRFAAVLAFLQGALGPDPATLAVFGADAGEEARVLCPDELEALFAQHGEVLRDAVAQHISTWAAIDRPTMRALTETGEPLAVAGDPLLGSMRLFADAGAGWEKFTTAKAYFYHPIRVVENLSPAAATVAKPAGRARTGTIVVHVVDRADATAGVRHGVHIESLFDERRTPFEPPFDDVNAARVEYGLVTPFVAGRYRVTVTPRSPADRVEGATKPGASLSREVEVTGGPVEVRFEVHAGPMTWTCHHRQDLLQEPAKFQVVPERTAAANGYADELTVLWRGGPEVVTLVDERTGTRTSVHRDPGQPSRYTLTALRHQDLDEGWNLLDARNRKAYDAPATHRLEVDGRSLPIEVFSPHEYELQLSFPRLRGLKCGSKYQGEKETHDQVAPSWVPRSLEVEARGWKFGGTRKVEAGEKPELELGFAQSALGGAGVSFLRDGAEVKVELLKLFGDVVKLARSVYEIGRVIQESVPEIGWYAEIDLGLFQGALSVAWGWREHSDHRVYEWLRLRGELTVFSVSLELGFGVSALTFAAQVFARVEGALKLSADLERVSPDGDRQATVPLTTTITGSVGARFEAGSWIQIEGSGSTALELNLQAVIGSTPHPFRLEGEVLWTGVEAILSASEGTGGAYGGYEVTSKPWVLVEPRTLGHVAWPSTEEAPPPQYTTKARLEEILTDTLTAGLNVRVATERDWAFDEWWELSRIVAMLADRIDATPGLQRDEKTMEALAHHVRQELDGLGRRWLRDWIDSATFEGFVNGGCLDQLLLGYVDPCAGALAELGQKKRVAT